MTATQAKQTNGKSYVLVIEDDRFLQKILLMKMRNDGFEVRGASDGEEGLSILKQGEPPDLVVLDLILPKVNGFEVLADIRRSSKLRGLPVLVLSNLAQEEDIKRVKEMGALEFLVKSNVSIQQVIEHVREAVARLSGAKGNIA
jgi:DNA-binding response OmpR family regulator